MDAGSQRPATLATGPASPVRSARAAICLRLSAHRAPRSCRRRGRAWLQPAKMEAMEPVLYSFCQQPVCTGEGADRSEMSPGLTTGRDSACRRREPPIARKRFYFIGVVLSKRICPDGPGAPPATVDSATANGSTSGKAARWVRVYQGFPHHTLRTTGHCRGMRPNPLRSTPESDRPWSGACGGGSCRRPSWVSRHLIPPLVVPTPQDYPDAIPIRDRPVRSRRRVDGGYGQRPHRQRVEVPSP